MILVHTDTGRMDSSAKCRSCHREYELRSIDGPNSGARHYAKTVKPHVSGSRW